MYMYICMYVLYVLYKLDCFTYTDDWVRLMKHFVLENIYLNI